MGFKIGDKVKILKLHGISDSSDLHTLTGKVGTVYREYKTSHHFQFRVQFPPPNTGHNETNIISFHKDELKKIVKKGEQLLFVFMKKV